MMPITPVAKGHMRLYSHIKPGLQAGVYTVELDQNFARAGDGDDEIGPVDGVTKHFEVTGPQIALAPNEIHSAFPPHNSDGPFQDQLPHVVLKRRTLPWERSGSTPGADTPWLALVLLSDAEGTFLRGVSVKDVFGTPLPAGVDQNATCDAIEVTTTTVEKVFPAETELPYLTHVRQVNVNDTEYAGNDEDGFMSVVMANRLPRPGVTYGAYLISLEGRFAELPDDAGTPVHNIGGVSVYNVPIEELAEYSTSQGQASTHYTLGSSSQPVSKAAAGTPAVSIVAEGTGDGKTKRQSSGWHTGTTSNQTATTAQTSLDIDNGYASTTSHGSMFVLNDMDLVALEENLLGAESVETTRFPVLAHWQFRCSEELDFRTLMMNLDVAMLGSEPPEGTTETPPAVTGTGHIRLENLTRAGERVPVWYRGPFVPRQIVRRERSAPFHSADQARTVGGHRIEAIGEAAAFEIGRMLALSDPAFLQEVLRWRRDGFQRLKTVDQVTDAGLGGLLTDDDIAHALGSAVARDLFVGLANAPTAPLGPTIDPAAGLTRNDDDAEVIAAGLGIPVARVRAAIGVTPGLSVPGTKVGAAPQAEIITFDDLVAAGDGELGHLRTELEQNVARILEGADPATVRRGS